MIQRIGRPIQRFITFAQTSLNVSRVLRPHRQRKFGLLDDLSAVDRKIDVLLLLGSIHTLRQKQMNGGFVIAVQFFGRDGFVELIESGFGPFVLRR